MRLIVYISFFLRFGTCSLPFVGDICERERLRGKVYLIVPHQRLKRKLFLAILNRKLHGLILFLHYCREALDVFSPRQLRLMMALNPWDRRMAYGAQIQEEVKAREAQLKNFFSNIEVAIRKFSASSSQTMKWQQEELTLSSLLTTTSAKVHASFLDSVNTRGALDALSDLIKGTNVYLASRQSSEGPSPQALLLRQCGAVVTRTLSVMGLTESDKLGMDGGSSEGQGDKRLHGILDAFSEFRDDIRSLAKRGAENSAYLTSCDRVRDEGMVELGVRLEDTPDGGSVWKLDDPEVLIKERDQKLAAIAANARKKLNSKLENLTREIAKFEKLEALPSPQEAVSAKYSKFNSDGYPTHDKEGNELEGKAIDKAKKDVDKGKKVRAPYEKKIAELGPNFLDDMRAQLSGLQSQLAELA